MLAKGDLGYLPMHRSSKPSSQLRYRSRKRSRCGQNTSAHSCAHTCNNPPLQTCRRVLRGGTPVAYHSFPRTTFPRGMAWHCGQPAQSRSTVRCLDSRGMSPTSDREPRKGSMHLARGRDRAASVIHQWRRMLGGDVGSVRLVQLHSLTHPITHCAITEVPRQGSLVLA